MRHLFFDLDGTLTDSAPGITRCLEHALTTLGRCSPERDSLQCFIGAPLPEIFAELLETQDADLIDSALRAYRERFIRVGASENSVYPGIREALGALAERGCSLYVATGKRGPDAQRIVRHFELDAYFRGVHGVEGENRDKALVLQRALGREQLAPVEAVMIGDRSHDVVAARACGVRCIGVAWGYATLGELERAAPDVVVESPAALVAYLLDPPGA